MNSHQRRIARRAAAREGEAFIHRLTLEKREKARIVANHIYDLALLGHEAELRPCEFIETPVQGMPWGLYVWPEVIEFVKERAETIGNSTSWKKEQATNENHK